MYGPSIHDRERVSATFEKDVVFMDIWGRGIFPRLRRWWHDLFLLSYADSRSKHYFMSSYAMMMARTAQYRRNRNCIHPFSKFSNFWNCLILYLLLIRMIVFHFTTSIIHTPHIFYYYLVAAIEYMFILDLYINAKTGYVIKRTRQIIMKPHDIMMHYLSTTACIHVFSAIPLQSLTFLRLGKDITDPASKANLFLCTVRLVSLVHIARLFQASEYWAKDRGTFLKTVCYKFVRIVVVGLVVIIQVYTLSLALSVIVSIVTGTVMADSFLGILMSFKYQFEPGAEKDDSFFVFLKLSRASKGFFLFGYGLLPNTECFDRITAILTTWISFMFHFWASVILYNCVSRSYSLEDRISMGRDQTLAYLRLRKLPDSIHAKVIKYFDYKMSSLIIMEKRNCLFKSLPNAMVLEIKMSCYNKYIMKISFFASLPREVVSQIVVLLEPEVYLDNDLVSSARSPQDGLVVLEAGLLAVYSSDQQETGHLVDGDYYGEMSLVTDRALPSMTVMAIMPSMVLLLDKIYFRSVMRRYPELFYSLRTQTVVE